MKQLSFFLLSLALLGCGDIQEKKGESVSNNSALNNGQTINNGEVQTNNKKKDPPLTSTCDPGMDTEVCQVFVIVNEERRDRSLPALVWNFKLAAAAQGHAADMLARDYFDHTSMDGRDFSARAKDAGYDDFPTGENIAFGQRDAVQVMVSWMNSEGHRRNILSEQSTEIGVGFKGNYWVQVFGKK